jgi:hypothetical protein
MLPHGIELFSNKHIKYTFQSQMYIEGSTVNSFCECPHRQNSWMLLELGLNHNA